MHDSFPSLQLKHFITFSSGSQHKYALAGAVNVAHITNIFRASLLPLPLAQGRRFLFLPLHPSAFRSGSTARSGFFQIVLDFQSTGAFLCRSSSGNTPHPEERICSPFILVYPHNGCAVHPYQPPCFRRRTPSSDCRRASISKSTICSSLGAVFWLSRSGLGRSPRCAGCIARTWTDGN